MDASVEVNYPVVLLLRRRRRKRKGRIFDNCNSNIYSNNIRVSTVAVKEIVEVEESILVSSRVADAASIQQCSSLFAHKVNFMGRVLPVEHCEQVIQRPSIPIRDISEQLHCVGSNGPSWIPRPEEVQVQRRGGKVPRSSGGYSKRPRLSPSEDSTGPDGVDNSKEPSDKLGSNPTKSDSHEKTQSAKQKNSFGSKRGERRHSKVTVKTKYDSFSMKASFSSFGSVAGGTTFLVRYSLSGLKADVHDITKLVDDVSLNDLLNGTYDSANTTESFLHSVRKACSVLQLPGLLTRECPHAHLTLFLLVENGDSSATNMSSSSNKVSSMKYRILTTGPETPANLLDFSFDQPKDTLGTFGTSSTQGSGVFASGCNQACRIIKASSLSAFPWSHTFTGHSRTNSDSVKCLPSRSACQGRWVRTGDSFNSPGSALVAFEPGLVVVGNNVDSLKPCCGWSLSTSLLQQHPMFCDLKSQGKVKRCPILVEAAQTLYDIATHVVRQNQDGMSDNTIKRPKPSTIGDKKDRGHINVSGKGNKLVYSKNLVDRLPINYWRLNCRSRHSAAYILKQACMMPPPAKALHRTYNDQQKVRK
ncbi:UPF0706 protein [Salix suchowensis]|nr:UPF0706 protein [Salix suchowensis]